MMADLHPLPIVILGAGGHGAVVGECVNPAQFTTIGYIDDCCPVGTTIMHDRRVIGRFEDLSRLASSYPRLAAVIAIGDNAVRRSTAEQAQRAAPSLSWPPIVHRSAIISPSSMLSPGCVIAAGAVVNCRTRLGRFVLINTGSTIEHDNGFAEFSSTGPGVVTGGAVEVGALTHIGIGATIKHGISIGANCVVGGQAYVDRSIDDDVVSYGVPARARQQRQPGAGYL